MWICNKLVIKALFLICVDTPLVCHVGSCVLAVVYGTGLVPSNYATENQITPRFWREKKKPCCWALTPRTLKWLRIQSFGRDELTAVSRRLVGDALRQFSSQGTLWLLLFWSFLFFLREAKISLEQLLGEVYLVCRGQQYQQRVCFEKSNQTNAGYWQGWEALRITAVLTQRRRRISWWAGFCPKLFSVPVE